MKILFTYKKSRSSFMATDIDILSTMATVKEYRFKEVKKIADLFEFIRQSFHILFNRYDVYYCFFCDYHSLIPVIYAKLRKRKSVVLIGGYDAMGLKGLKYGIFNSLWRGWIARKVYKYASHILTFSDALQAELTGNGIALDARFRTVYCGLDPDKYQVDMKENICLLVGRASDHTNYLRKGYDRFHRLSKLLPEYRFMSVGLTNSFTPDGVENYPDMLHANLLRLMGRAKVYIQPSRAEGFSVSITEAMLSGCRIVASDANGIPENYPGYCFTQKEWDGDLTTIAGTISIAMREPVDQGLIRYAAKKFNLEIRRKELYRIINT